jgi:ABC-type Na+ efflux pump permease subunit
MKTLFIFIKKEFAHVLRDRKTLFILFGMPVVQILIFGFALSSEVKNAQVMIMDEAKDEYSQRIINVSRPAVISKLIVLSLIIGNWKKDLKVAK